MDKHAEIENMQRNLNMADLTGYGRLAQFSKLTDRMIDDASKEALALTSQVLAIQVGHYQRKFGVIPIDEAIDLLEAEGVSDEQAGWIADGLENLAVVLSSIEGDEESPTTLQ
jgi:hypothetical protein